MKKLTHFGKPIKIWPLNRVKKCPVFGGQPKTRAHRLMIKYTGLFLCPALISLQVLCLTSPLQAGLNITTTNSALANDSVPNSTTPDGTMADSTMDSRATANKTTASRKIAESAENLSPTTLAQEYEKQAATVQTEIKDRENQEKILKEKAQTMINIQEGLLRLAVLAPVGIGIASAIVEDDLSIAARLCVGVVTGFKTGLLGGVPLVALLMGADMFFPKLKAYYNVESENKHKMPLLKKHLHKLNENAQKMWAQVKLNTKHKKEVENLTAHYANWLHTTHSTNTKEGQPKTDRMDRFLGYNAAHMAVAYGDVPVLQNIAQKEPGLLEKADIHGHTAFDIALATGNPQIAEVFAQYHGQQSTARQLLDQSLQQHIVLVNSLADLLKTPQFLQDQVKPLQIKKLNPDDNKYKQLAKLFKRIVDTSQKFDAHEIKKQRELYLKYETEHGINALDLALAAGNYPAVSFFVSEGLPFYRSGPHKMSTYTQLKMRIKSHINFVRTYIKASGGPVSQNTSTEKYIQLLEKGVSNLPSSCEALLTTMSKS